MKKIVSLIVVVVLFTVGTAFAVVQSAGTSMFDANMVKTDNIGWDINKIITATLTGTKTSFSNQTLATGTHQLQISCYTPTTGAAAAGRVLLNNTGTEIAVYGYMPNPVIIPKAVTSIAFNKYSTATATDSVKCTAIGN